jgi:hypothetical protein
VCASKHGTYDDACACVQVSTYDDACACHHPANMSATTSSQSVVIEPYLLVPPAPNAAALRIAVALPAVTRARAGGVCSCTHDGVASARVPSSLACAMMHLVAGAVAVVVDVMKAAGA